MDVGENFYTHIVVMGRPKHNSRELGIHSYIREFFNQVHNLDKLPIKVAFPHVDNCATFLLRGLHLLIINWLNLMK